MKPATDSQRDFIWGLAYHSLSYSRKEAQGMANDPELTVEGASKLIERLLKERNEK